MGSIVLRLFLVHNVLSMESKSSLESFIVISSSKYGLNSKSGRKPRVQVHISDNNWPLFLKLYTYCYTIDYYNYN
uniref:Uncharacterized protein n=1 Tax=Lepeophtheirus salmonis TaxID=72036 RepID=A0A0K2UC79_LEPSM